MAATGLPLGYHSVTPFLIVPDGEGFIRFTAEAFGATERERITRPDGSIGHAEVQIGDSVVMLTEATGELPARASALYVHVEDVDAVFEQALRAGATARSAPADQFYGNREAGLIDSWGTIWWIATIVEAVPASELQSRYEAQR